MRCLRIQTVDFDLPGAVNIFAIEEINPNMNNPSFCIAEKQQVAELRIFPLVGSENFPVEGLLRGIAFDDDAVCEIADFSQSGAVGHFG